MLFFILEGTRFLGYPIQLWQSLDFKNGRLTSSIKVIENIVDFVFNQHVMVSNE